MIKLETVAGLRDHVKQPAAKEALHMLLIDGLSGQERYIYTLIGTRGPISVNELCDIINRPSNHVGNIISKFLRLGLIVREHEDWKYLYRVSKFTGKH
jgi:predicted transcriptional regulator